MKISSWKVVWNFITGGGVGVVDYLLGLLKQVFAGLGDPTKEKITATLNFTLKVLAVVEVVRVFIPARWQIAYSLTVAAIRKVAESLKDLEITGEELQAIMDGYTKAYEAWKGPDDDTCADPALEFKAA